VEIVRGLFPADEVVTQGAYSLAFAGAGTLSLKAALDAAHGHEHNPDGSELTPEQKKGAAKMPAGGGKVREHDHQHAHQNPFWMIVSGILFVLLIATGVRRKSRDDAEGTTDDSGNSSEKPRSS